MDEFYESTNTVERALQLSTDLRKVLATGSFNLTKWITTSPEILSAIPQQHRAKSHNEWNDPRTTKRILEIEWNISSDSPVSEPKKFQDLERKKPTQRNLLHTSSSLFDPIGFAAPVTIRLRILQQNIWRKGLKWDDQITKADLTELFDLLQETDNLQPLHVPRNYFAELTSEFILQIFSDASYAALHSVSYLVYSTVSDTRPKITFDLGKARVAPLKQCTITKMELQAALFCAHLPSFIRQQQRFSLSYTYLWTDSSTVFNGFMDQTKDNKSLLQILYQRYWRSPNLLCDLQYLQKHWPGYLNPADDWTRGISFSVFNLNRRWFNGPDIIPQLEDAWPKQPSGIASPSNTVESERQHDCVFSVTEKCLPDQHHSCYVRAFQDPMFSSSCISYKRFLKWNPLLRATAFVLIAAALFRNSTSESSIGQSVSQTPHQKPRQHNLIRFSTSATSPPLTTEENQHHGITLNASDIILLMKFLVKKSQQDSFPNELKDVPKRNIVATSSRIRPLLPFLEEPNIMRAKGKYKSHDLLIVQSFPLF